MQALARSSLLAKARARPDLVRQVMRKARTEGLAATIDWYRANEWWWMPQKAETEARYLALNR